MKLFLASLPRELVDCIIEYIDDESLVSVLLTCRALSDIGRRGLFREVVLSPSHESLRGFRQILEDSSLSSLIPRVFVDIADWDQPKFPKKFWVLFNGFKKLSGLQRVALNFDSVCRGTTSPFRNALQNVTLRSIIMRDLMSFLAGLSKPLRKLALYDFDLKSINDKDLLAVENITKLLQDLTSLRA